MPVTTTRLLIVCTEAVRVQMNDTLNTIDPASSGDIMVAQVALASDPTTGVGRWTSWAMPEEHKTAIIAAFAGKGWAPLKGTEGKVLGTVDAVPAWGRQRFWLFDGLTWEPYAALAAMGLVLWTPLGEE